MIDLSADVNAALQRADVDRMARSAVAGPVFQRKTGQRLRQGGFLLNPFRFGTLDPYAGFIWADLQFPGADASTTITDTKGSTWTRSGSAAISTATASPWDNNTLLLPSSGANYVQTPGGTGTPGDLGSGDFALCVWGKMTSAPGIGVGASFAGCRLSSGSAPFSFGWYYFNSSGTHTLNFWFSNDGSNIVGTRTVSASIANLTSWNHYAVVRSGNSLYFFVNGVQQGSTQSITGSLFQSASTPLHVGMLDGVNTGTKFIGNLKGFRVYKGTDRGWTSNFTPDNPMLPAV